MRLVREFMRHNASSANISDAQRVHTWAEGIDVRFQVDGRLATHASSRTRIAAWAHEYGIDQPPEYAKRNRRFRQDLDLLEEDLERLDRGEGACTLCAKEVQAHRLPADLKEEAREFHEQEGTPIDWLPSTRQLEELGHCNPWVASRHSYGPGRLRRSKAGGHGGDGPHRP